MKKTTLSILVSGLLFSASSVQADSVQYSSVRVQTNPNQVNVGQVNISSSYGQDRYISVDRAGSYVNVSPGYGVSVDVDGVEIDTERNGGHVSVDDDIDISW